MADVMDFNRECCLCLQIFTDPRVLPCLHTFCLKCLKNMGATVPNDWLLCPVCGSKFTVPEEGLTGLPKNIFAEKSADVRTTSKFKSAESTLCDACAKVNLGDKNNAEKYCINCEEKLCFTCCVKHEKEKEHLIVDFSCQKETKTEEEEACRCRVHQEETPKLFCTFCKKVICDKCFHESHSSHNCSDITDVSNLVCKLAEKEYNIVEKMQLEFQERMETLHREQMKCFEKVKKMETEILKRCEEIKELVVKETKALLQELAVLKRERLEEIEMEHRRVDKHIFTLEKFKEYCTWIKSNGTLIYTCEAEFMLRKTADELRIHEKSRIENRLFPLQFEFQKTDVQEFVMPISNAIGKISVICPYKMEQPTAINTNARTVHGITSLQDKLYLLSDSILIHRAENPYDRVGEIKTPDIKSPASIVSCCQTSCLYIYDKGNACIWKVSIPDHQVTRWLDKVKEPRARIHWDCIQEQCTLNVTSTGEVLMTTQSAGAEQPVTVEIYDKNAILTERIELPKNIQSLERIYKTRSGNYIGFGEKNLYKFRTDGSTVGQAEITKYPDIGNCFRCIDVSPYHVFLSSSPSVNSWGSTVSLITSDLTCHRTLLGSKEKIVFSICYVNATKRLAVLEHFQVQMYNQMGARQGVTVYNVL